MMPCPSPISALASRSRLLPLLAAALLMALPGRASATLCCNPTTFECMVQTGGVCPGGFIAISGIACAPGSCTPQWSPGAWGTCSGPCGGGIQTRTVVCTIGGTTVADSVCVAGGAGTKPATLQHCNTEPCPVDCVVSAWSAWSPCSVPCGGGIQTRTRTILVPAANGGTACPNLIESQACNTSPCPVWSTGPWETCSAVCGPGTQTRTVVCIVGSTIVPESECASSGPRPAAAQSCNNGPCPGACCNRHTGGCLVLSPTDCATFGGTFAGPSTVCSPATCTACPADFNGVGGLSIDDLFLYLNAYFTGC